ncbi:hypothetical protein GQ43DRAFT_119889 [Delitschia confertaspora ATCC 74209]|uniref:Uncharacterized protein n=1 Tax=Delitschia confertaspora ATCC 74209 TaxID=1513339 RepID=A0A9P4JHJ6_9PLEO|nr:hypothetical protein GQ43DRAFT_119889 [Delitschia confertaspora ATCC 74209]
MVSLCLGASSREPSPKSCQPAVFCTPSSASKRQCFLLPFDPDLSIDRNGFGDATEDIEVLLRRYRVEEVEDLQHHFGVPELDEHAGNLQFASMAISPLHKLGLEGRETAIAEDARLHLVRSNTKVFIKPLPPYLLLYQFWAHYLKDDTPLRKVILGYLHTWSCLIEHESDFRVAMNHGLLPENLKWYYFRDISAQIIRKVGEQDVSPRYRLGELRLSRLNLAARPLFKRRKYYPLAEPRREINWPHLFLGFFSLFAVILRAMQVLLQAEQNQKQNNEIKAEISHISGVVRWSCISFLLVFAAGIVIMITEFIYSVIREWVPGRNRWDEMLHNRTDIVDEFMQSHRPSSDRLSERRYGEKVSGR